MEHRCVKRRNKNGSRRGVTLFLFLAFLVVTIGLVAFAVDVGFIMLTRTQLQVAADAAAMAAAAKMGASPEDAVAVAKQYAGYHMAGGKPVELQDADVEFGTWDAVKRTFTPGTAAGNAVRVTARRDHSAGGQAPLFFARIFNQGSFASQASAVAMANPRDIAFVVDLSGSMNDDAEPCWAIGEINKTFGPQGYPGIGTELIRQVFEDFGFGAYPGTMEHVGECWGVAQDEYAYAELTKNGGPLTSLTVPSKYRVNSGDAESRRKQKAYSAIMDYQIARIMPAAKPAPNSSASYAYWERYLDYIIRPVRIGSSGKGTPPADRGTLPISQSSDRITGFNNPNGSTFPEADGSVPAGYRDKIGYVTYVQFMMDFGRDGMPAGTAYTPLSRLSPDCPWHAEDTAGGTFYFPPREQPVHAARRALIAAVQVVRERNSSIPDLTQRDWVSVITFDTIVGGDPVIQQPLTGDYDAAMQACTGLQAVGDLFASTASEAGLIAAKNHIRPRKDGGQGRECTNKVVVLLTDGVPNLYVSSNSAIDKYMRNHPGPEFYGGHHYPYDAALVQTMMMQRDNWAVFPVGVGLGTDYDFMDRLSRLGGTADEHGKGPRGSGNPADYEQRLADIFKKIITSPKVRLVQ
jgi:hypothetical protein